MVTGLRPPVVRAAVRIPLAGQAGVIQQKPAFVHTMPAITGLWPGTGLLARPAGKHLDVSRNSFVTRYRQRSICLVQMVLTGGLSAACEVAPEQTGPAMPGSGRGRWPRCHNGEVHGLRPGHTSKRRGGRRGAVPAVMAVTGRLGTGPGGCRAPHAQRTGKQAGTKAGKKLQLLATLVQGFLYNGDPFGWRANCNMPGSLRPDSASDQLL